MSKAQSFLVVALAYFSVCVGATLMQITVTPPSAYVNNDICENFVDKYRDTVQKKIAKEIYQEAFSLTFKGKWEEAKHASQCAALLEHGSISWAIESHNLIDSAP
jgi:hypothetical protein